MIARSRREDTLEVALALAKLPEAHADRRRRHLMEGSFAHAANLYHFKRSRWRRSCRQQIQDWLIAVVQNIAILCGGTASTVPALKKTPPGRGSARATPPRSRVFIRDLLAWLVRYFVKSATDLIASAPHRAA